MNMIENKDYKLRTGENIRGNTKEKIIKIIKLSVDKMLSKAYNNKCR